MGACPLPCTPFLKPMMVMMARQAPPKRPKRKTRRRARWGGSASSGLRLGRNTLPQHRCTPASAIRHDVGRVCVTICNGGLACHAQVCEVDTDYEGDTITHYECKVQGVDADTCTKAGGKVEEDECKMDMGGMDFIDPSSGPALSKDKRNAACAKIGGIPTPVSVVACLLLTLPHSPPRVSANSSLFFFWSRALSPFLPLFVVCEGLRAA